jgi:type 1 glutamine amidotransferase
MIAAVLAVAASIAPVPAAAPAAADAPRVLVFTRTEGFRHDSIPDGLRVLRQAGLRVTATEDPRALTLRALRRHDALVFLQTTGDVLDAPQERAVERYVRGGGGWAGIHAAADTEYRWPFYRTLLGGARFRSHPEIQQASLDVVHRDHPATARVPRRWTRTDEWYAFSARPTAARVLLRIDERTYDPGAAAMGADHPMAWHRRVGRGRAFYTALGHTRESYAEPAFRRHLLGGVRWAAR